LAKLRNLKGLADLDLRYTRVTSNGLASVRAELPGAKVQFAGAAAPTSRVHAAEHPSSDSEDAIVAWLKSLGGMTKSTDGHVTAVNLSATPISDAQLASLGGLHHLERLELQVTQVGDLGLAALTSLTGLKELNLSNTTVSDAGIEKLSTLSHLRTLRLSGTLIEGPGIAHLASLRELRNLDLSNTHLSDKYLIDVARITSGKIQLRESYAQIDKNEAWLNNAHISEYSHGNRENHSPVRSRKLLLHRREIDKLLGKTREKGLSLIPTKIYLKKGRIKCELALAKGKKLHDKRETERKRTAQEEARAEIRRRA